MANLSNINNKFLVTTGGDVGVGITSPVEKLDTLNIAIGGATITSYSPNKLRIDNNGGNSRFYSTGANTTTAGSYQIHVTSSDGSINNPALTIASNTNATFAGTVNATGYYGPGQGLDNLLPLGVYSTTPGTAGVLIKTNIVSNNYGFIFGTINLEQFNQSNVQRIQLSATVASNGTVATKAATSDIAITMKLFHTGGYWYIHLPTPSTYVTVSAYIYTGAGYQGQAKGFNEVDTITVNPVPSGATSSVDIVADVYLTTGTSSPWLKNGNDIYNSNSGNVGIGTTLPLSLSANTSSLSVNSTRTDLTGGLFLKANDVSKVQLYWATSGFINEIISGSCLWYTNNAPKMELLAGDASQLTLKAKSGTYGQAAILRLEGTNSSTYGGTVIADSTITSFTDGTAYGAHLTFGLNNTSNVVTERMRITSGGNVGINYTGPYNQISGGETTLAIADADNASLYLKSNATGGHNHILFSGTGGSLSFYDKTRGDYSMIIDNLGNVGINTTGPTAKLHITEQAESNYFIKLTGTLGTGNTYGFKTNGGDSQVLSLFDVTSTNRLAVFGNTEIRFATGGTERFLIDSSGNVDIANPTTGNAGTRIWGGSDGGIIYMYRPINQGTQVMRFYVGTTSVGYIGTSNTGAAFVSNSDYRLKENVVELTGALDRISELKPSRFNFIVEPNKTVDGFLAHEVQDIVPEAVFGEKDAVDEEGNPDYQAMEQSKLVPLLVAAIQELKAEIELLKSK